jgi:hypothetical protein
LNGKGKRGDNVDAFVIFALEEHGDYHWLHPHVGLWSDWNNSQLSVSSVDARLEHHHKRCLDDRWSSQGFSRAVDVPSVHDPNGTQYTIGFS